MDVLSAEFAPVGVTGHVHVREVENASKEIGLGSDEPVVLASVFKVLLALEYARQAVAGQLDPAERIRVTAADRLGGVGTAGCQDEIDISWRDLAMFAMSLSDNTAADLLLRRVGVDPVQMLAAGCSGRRVRGGEYLQYDGYTIEVFESLHSMTGPTKQVPFPGTRPGAAPARPQTVADLVEGGTLAYQITIHERFRILILSTAKFSERDLSGLHPDLAIVAAGGGSTM